MSDLIRIFSGTVDDGLVCHISPTLDPGDGTADLIGSNPAALIGATIVSETTDGGLRAFWTDLASAQYAESAFDLKPHLPGSISFWARQQQIGGAATLSLIHI